MPAPSADCPAAMARVTPLQFTTWPDRSIPEAPSSLLTFGDLAREQPASHPGCWTHPGALQARAGGCVLGGPLPGLVWRKAGGAESGTWAAPLPFSSPGAGRGLHGHLCGPVEAPAAAGGGGDGGRVQCHVCVAATPASHDPASARAPQARVGSQHPEGLGGSMWPGAPGDTRRTLGEGLNRSPSYPGLVPQLPRGGEAGARWL